MSCLVPAFSSVLMNFLVGSSLHFTLYGVVTVTVGLSYKATLRVCVPFTLENAHYSYKDLANYVERYPASLMCSLMVAIYIVLHIYTFCRTS